MTKISSSPIRMPPQAAPRASEAGSAATRAARPSTPPATRAFDAAYWSELERLSGKPAAKATNVTFLRESDAAWDARIDLVRQSKSSIVGSLYILNADNRGFQLLEELIAARRRGVEVCVALDLIATGLNMVPDKKDERARFKELLGTLQAEGGVVTWAGTLDDQLKVPGAGVHLKTLIADNRAAIVGGRNIAEHYFHDWSDFDTRLEGPIVQQLSRETLDLLRTCDATPKPWQRDAAADRTAATVLNRLESWAAEASSNPAAGQAGPEFQLVAHDPVVDGKLNGKSNCITAALVETVKRAKTEILLSSNVVGPAPELREALIDAAKRGVKVRMITSGPKAVGGPVVHEYAAIRCADLLAAGCELWETKSHEHGKMFFVDGKVGAYGSYNASNHADRRNAEGLLFTADPKVVAELKRCLEETRSKCTQHVAPSTGFGGWLYRMAEKLFG